MRVIVLMFLSLVASPLSATAAKAQPAATPPIAAAPSDTVDSNVRHDVVAKLSEALRNNYIYPDVGETAAEKINAALSAGAYESLSDTNTFAARLSSDVGAITHDKHLRVISQSAPPAPPPGAGGGMPLSEAGVTRADKLAGGIGYIEVVGFPPLPVFRPTVDKAMSALRGSRALIIDDRRNGGGSPDGVAYLVSFLVAPKRTIEITDIVARVPKTNSFTRERHSSQPTPLSFATIPVYVLTSKNTFSGGEELAYDVQTHKLAKVIGEVTGGGAHPTGPVDIGHGFVAMIPFARSEDPITKTNWEGTGVQPDVRVAASDALKVALERLGQKPIGEIEAASIKQVFAPRAAPLPGTELALRRLLNGLATGNPDYSAMTPAFADVARQHLSELQRQLTKFGALQKIQFRRAMMTGDEFELTFANGKALMAIMLNGDGKIENALPPLPISGDK